MKSNKKTPNLFTLETMEQETETGMLNTYSKLASYNIRMTRGISTQAVYLILLKNDGMK